MCARQMRLLIPSAARAWHAATGCALVSLCVGVLLISHRHVTAEEGLERYYPLLDKAAEQQESRRVYTPLRRVYLTREGGAFMSFPNYDIRLFPGAFGGFTEELTEVEQIYPNVIFKNRGYYWDGDEFFLSPNYPYDERTRFRYAREIVGAPRGTIWPEGPEKRFADMKRPKPTLVQPGGEPPVSLSDVTRMPSQPRDHVQRFLGIPLPPTTPTAAVKPPEIPVPDYPSWQKAADEQEASDGKEVPQPPAGARRLKKTTPPRLRPLREVGPQPPKK